MKLPAFKILLSSYILLFSNGVFSTENTNLIHEWKQKGFLVFSIPVKFDPLEPTFSLNAHTKLSLPLIFEPLIAVAAQQELQPILAKSWQITSDGKSMIVTINPNHFFSDNTEVIAQDVVDSIRRVCSPGSKVFAELKGLENCEAHGNGRNIEPQIKAIGKYEILFNINCSPTSFLYQLSSPSIVINKITKSGLIGSGPYVVQEKKDSYLILKKNPYYSSSKLVKNNGVVLFYTKNDDISLLVKNDKPDGSIMYRMEDIRNVKDKNYNIYKINPNITEILVLNNQRFPFNHSIVRKALSNALYNHFNNECTHGTNKAYGVIPYGTGGSIANTSPKSLTEISPQELFLKVPALKHKKSTVTFHQLEDLKNNCESQEIVKTANQYNIDVKFKYHKNYSTLDPLYLNHKLDGFIELYVFRNREAYSILQFFTKEGENNANIADTTIDKMLSEAIAEPASHGRFQSYRRIAEYLQNESIVIPLFYMDHGNILSKCITGTSENFLFNPFFHIPQIYKIKGCTI